MTFSIQQLTLNDVQLVNAFIMQFEDAQAAAAYMVAPDHEEKREHLTLLLTEINNIEQQLKAFKAIKCEQIQVTVEANTGMVWGWSESHDEVAITEIKATDLGEKVVDWLATQSLCHTVVDSNIGRIVTAYQALGYAVEDYAYVRTNTAAIMNAFDYAEVSLEVMLGVQSALVSFTSFTIGRCEVFANPDDQKIWGFADNADAELLGDATSPSTVVRVLNWLFYSSDDNPALS